MGMGKDLQESLNGQAVSCSPKDRVIRGHRQLQKLCHSSPLPLFISPDSFLLSYHLETLHLFLSFSYQAVAILNIFMEFVIEFLKVFPRHSKKPFKPDTG